MPFIPPANALGADLVWWRDTDALHTLVTIHARAYDGLIDDVVLHCVLFDGTGASRVSWQVPMAGREFCVIDSARLADWRATPLLPSVPASRTFYG